MTTRLDGPATRFLPFNLGRRRRRGQPAEPGRPPDLATCGSRSGSGTPGSTSSRRFIHVERPARGRRRRGARPARSIFPRYHQWDAVRAARGARPRARRRAAATSSSTRPARASRTRSPGSPTGSRRCTTRDDRKVFDKVIVITDRRRPRPPAPGHDLPVRARPRRRREDRQGLRAARRGARRASRRGSSSRRCRSSRSSSTRSPSSASAATPSSSTRRTPRRPARPPRT